LTKHQGPGVEQEVVDNEVTGTTGEEA